MRDFKIVILLFSLLLAKANAQQHLMKHLVGPVLPLDSVLTILERENPALQESFYKAKALDTYAQGATSWEAPKVSAGLWMTPYNQNKAREMNNGQTQGMAMISVEQTFPNPARQRANRDYMAAQSSVERANGRALFNALKAQAKTLYYEWVILEKKENVLTENESLLRFLIRLAEVRYPYNQSKLNSIYEAQAKLDMHLNDHEQVTTQIRQKNIGLNTLMNRSKDWIYEVDTLLPANFSLDLPADTATLAAQRSDILSLDYTIGVTRLNQRRESLMRKPDFGVQYSHMNSLGRMPNQFTLMGTVTIPFAPWAAKKYKANVAAMDDEIAAMQRQRENILNEAGGQLASMQAAIRNKQQQVERFEKRIIPTLKKNYEVTLRAYEQNTTELPSVIEAWETLSMTQAQLLDTMNELLTMRVAYERELEK